MNTNRKFKNPDILLTIKELKKINFSSNRIPTLNISNVSFETLSFVSPTYFISSNVLQNIYITDFVFIF